MELKMINVLALAYLGDSIYEVYVRKYLLEKGISKVQELQKEAISYVSAKNQSAFLHDMIDQNFLSEEELEIVRRARNHKGNRHPKNTDIVTYKESTGLEALIGYLELKEDRERIEQVMKFILGE